MSTIGKAGVRVYTTLNKYPALPNLCLTEEIVIMNLSISPFDSVDLCFMYFEAILLCAYKFPSGLTHFALQNFLFLFLGMCIALKSILSDIT